jgi:hypothetical protein
MDFLRIGRESVASDNFVSGIVRAYFVIGSIVMSTNINTNFDRVNVICANIVSANVVRVIGVSTV